jgi:hypothetical protein
MELFQTRFPYRQETVFNASTYLAFLEQRAQGYRRQGAILIQDNASYPLRTAMCGVVWRESAVVGSSPTPTLLAGVEPHGKTVAIHAENRDLPSILF